MREWCGQLRAARHVQDSLGEQHSIRGIPADAEPSVISVASCPTVVLKVAQGDRVLARIVAKGKGSIVTATPDTLPPQTKAEGSAKIAVGELVVAVAIQENRGPASRDAWCSSQLETIAAAIPALDARDPLRLGQVDQLAVLHCVMPQQTDAIEFGL